VRGPDLAQAVPLSRSRRRGARWPSGRLAPLLLIALGVSATQASTGDSLPEDKVKDMFDAVDSNGDGKIEFVKYYKACIDEVGARSAPPDGKNGGFSLASLFGKT